MAAIDDALEETGQAHGGGGQTSGRPGDEVQDILDRQLDRIRQEDCEEDRGGSRGGAPSREGAPRAVDNRPAWMTGGHVGGGGGGSGYARSASGANSESDGGNGRQKVDNRPAWMTTGSDGLVIEKHMQTQHQDYHYYQQEQQELDDDALTRQESYDKWVVKTGVKNIAIDQMATAARDTVVEAVREKIGSLKQEDSQGNTPMISAAASGDLIVMIGLEGCEGTASDARKASRHGTTPLLAAAANGHYDVVVWLLEKVRAELVSWDVC